MLKWVTAAISGVRIGRRGRRGTWRIDLCAELGLGIVGLLLNQRQDFPRS